MDLAGLRARADALCERWEAAAPELALPRGECVGGDVARAAAAALEVGSSCLLLMGVPNAAC